MRKYITTKEQCENKINKDYVCEYCGRKIQAIETVDNSNHPTFWQGCWHTDQPDENSWGCFTGGVPQEVFELAKKLVCDKGGYYNHLRKADYRDDLDKRKYWVEQQTSGWVGLLKEIEYLRNNQPRKTMKELLEDKYF